jgi:hypothetical protein
MRGSATAAHVGVNIGSGDAILSDVVVSGKVAFLTFGANLLGDTLIVIALNLASVRGAIRGKSAIRTGAGVPAPPNPRGPNVPHH